jgi:hypothetical protein
VAIVVEVEEARKLKKRIFVDLETWKLGHSIPVVP